MPHYELKLEAVGAWTLTEEDEAARREEAEEQALKELEENPDA